MGNNNRINVKIKKSMNVINFTNKQLSESSRLHFFPTVTDYQIHFDY